MYICMCVCIFCRCMYVSPLLEKLKRDTNYETPRGPLHTPTRTHAHKHKLIPLTVAWETCRGHGRQSALRLRPKGPRATKRLPHMSMRLPIGLRVCVWVRVCVNMSVWVFSRTSWGTFVNNIRTSRFSTSTIVSRSSLGKTWHRPKYNPDS